MRGRTRDLIVEKFYILLYWARDWGIVSSSRAARYVTGAEDTRWIVNGR